MQFQAVEDVVICHNCAHLIANGECIECVAHSDRDLNGEECTHGPDKSCAGWTIAVNDSDNGWREVQCWSCGVFQCGDDWHAATAFQYTAEYLRVQAAAMFRLSLIARPGSEVVTAQVLTGLGSTGPALFDRACELSRLAVKAQQEYTTPSV